MSDVRLLWPADASTGDIALDGPDLARDESMSTAVLLSLATDRRAPDGADIPDGSGDPRGWWGDAFADVAGDEIGSHLWLLDRDKMVTETLSLAEDYCVAALAWMIADGVVKAVSAAAQRVDDTSAGIAIILTRPDGAQSRYDYLWSQTR